MKQKNNPEKVVIYSALFGDIDQVTEPEFNIPNCDMKLFTDNPNQSSDHFEVKVIDTNRINLGNRELARLIKIMPHLFLHEYEISIWIDSRVIIHSPKIVATALERLGDKDLALFHHSLRDTIEEEYKELLSRGKANPYILHEQMEIYKYEGMDQTPFLAETGFIVRKHNTLEMIEFAKLWWHEILSKTSRDQISLPYVLWRLPRIEFNVIEGNIWDNDIIRVGEHNSASKDYTGSEKIVNPFSELKHYIDWFRVNYEQITTEVVYN